MFPIEQTNETIASRGPTRGPRMAAAVGLSARKTSCSQDVGTHAANAPAMSRPSTMSTQTLPSS